MSRNFKLTLVALMTMSLAMGVGAAGMNAQGRNLNIQQPQFSDIDKNADGQITQDEMEVFRTERIQQRTEEGRTLQNLDRNIAAFDSFDKDNDGLVSEQEFTAHQMVASSENRNDNLKGKAGNKGKNGKNKANSGNRGGNRGKNVTNDARARVYAPAFSDLDTNADGMISTEEHEAFRAERIGQRTEEGRTLRNLDRNIDNFATFDTDSDGFISADEFVAHQGSGRQYKGKK